MKLGGAILLLGCGLAWAGMKNRDEQADIARVAAFGELFARVGERIEGLCLPLDEILASLPPPLLTACGLTYGAGEMAHLHAAVERVRDREAADILAQTAAQLGRGTSGDQVRLCRSAAERLQCCRERMAGAWTNNARARVTLVMSAVLGGIILLW